MSSFRTEKKQLLTRLASKDWKETVYFAITTPATALLWLNPLLAMLPRPEVQWQASLCFGKTVALIADDNREDARNIMRRLMWSMNEESGNFGWGIPQAMACAIAASPAMAKEFGHILISYIMDTGRPDNYLDHQLLRLGAFWGIGHVCQMHVPFFLFGKKALPWLVIGLEQDTQDCRGMAAWALQLLAVGATKESVSPDAAQKQQCTAALVPLISLAQKKGTVPLFDGTLVKNISFASLASAATQAITTFMHHTDKKPGKITTDIKQDKLKRLP